MKYKIAICDDSDTDGQYALNMIDRGAVYDMKIGRNIK